MNAANYDTTTPSAFDDITRAYRAARALPDELIPLVIDGEERFTGAFEIGRDPSEEGRRGIGTASLTSMQIDDAVRCAGESRPSWSQLSIEQRRHILYRCAAGDGE